MKRRKFQSADQINNLTAEAIPSYSSLRFPMQIGARRIPFVKRFLDGQKFGFAMQIGTARNMKELVNIILGHGHKSGHR